MKAKQAAFSNWRFWMVIALALAMAMVAFGQYSSPVSADAAGDNGGGSGTGDHAIQVSSHWYATTNMPPAFFWGGAGVVWSGDSFTYNHPNPVTITVTDDFCKGDRFEVYLDGNLIGTTSAVASDHPGCSPSVGPYAAYADPTYSSGAFPAPAGQHTITIKVINNPFAGGRGYIQVHEPGETTPPTCAITGVTYPPFAIEVTAQDTGSGLAAIVPVMSINVNVAIPPIPFGTTDPVVVTVTQIDPAMGFGFTLALVDVLKNVTLCDPEATLTVREDGKPVSETLTVPQAESTVTVKNGDPGLKNLDIEVNGERFKVAGLGDNEVVTIDVSSAMVEGDNTITLTAYGKPGASATVVISDF